MATREQAMTALLALVQSSASFAVSGRRNRSPDAIGPAQSPAVFLIESADDYQTNPVGPDRRTMTVKAFYYNDVGDDETAIPSTAINNAIEALEALLAPTPGQRGSFTLGGLVFSCRIDGQIKRAPGEVTGKSMAVVPIKIVLP